MDHSNTETNIKPWNDLQKDMKEGNNITKWMDREPYAYWKGNVQMGVVRKELWKCRSTNEHDWNARLYTMVTAQSFLSQYYIYHSDKFKICRTGFKRFEVDSKLLI